MKYDRHIIYNQSSSKKYDWDPTWFGAKKFDEELIEKVIAWQKSYGLQADGLVGPSTYRRLWTEREADISDHEPALTKCYKNINHIVHNGNFLPINWEKVVLWDEAGGFKADKGCYTDYSGRPDREPKMFVNHWDVCLSSESCAKVLNKRGISVHFLIDNDGTIYQMLDTQHKAWHAGLRSGVGGNQSGIGVEIANAYYPKYQDWYVKKGLGPRPIVEGCSVHGRKMEPFLDFYPVQIEALLALWEALHEGLGIPYEYPANRDGSLNTSVDPKCVNGTFTGFCNHYNFTKGKIDCANLNIKHLLQKLS